MRVWVVGHAYVTETARDKLRALAGFPDVALTVMAPAAWRDALGTLRQPAGDGAYRVVPSRVLLNGRIGAYLYRDGWRRLRRARPDIVHAEVEPWSLAACQCLLAARGARLVVFTWENLEGPRRVLSRAIERMVLRRTAFVIAGNRAARARVLRRGVGPDRVAVLPQFGVDPDRYARGDASRVPVPLARGRPVVGYVGRLAPEKGLGVLAGALEEIDARFLVVGDGPARPDLERWLAAWPDGKARLAGAVSEGAVPDYLACLDVLVLPSRTTSSWAEQFGHVIIEAMAAGIPVVGSSCGAIPEVIGDAGLIFPEDDAQALRRQIAWILGDARLRATLVARGHERVRTHFTHAAVAGAQHEIWARLLGGPGVAPTPRPGPVHRIRLEDP